YPLAIIGFSCYIPDATSPEEYWQNLVSDHVSIKPIDSSRVSNVFFAPDPKHDKKAKKGRSYYNIAALVDYDRFCNDEVPRLRAEFARHGVGSDVLPKAPGHLLALKVALEALRSTGVDPFNLPSSEIGVFCGLLSANKSDEYAPVHPNADVFVDILNSLPSFQTLPSESRAKVIRAFLAKKTSSCAMGRDEFLSSEQPHQVIRSIQNAFGLRGDGYAFDAVCSSSLLAFELARSFLQSGKLDAAIVGGVTFVASPHVVQFTKASSCSARGSFPFDDRADGLVPGEGCVFMVVKSLEKAIKNGDRIWGIVRGVGVATDGRGKSLWAPLSDGQTLAIRRAFKDSGYKSWSELDKIEAHATSTRLGDATELQALSNAMEDTPLPEWVKIPITSVKANLGHLLKTAGVASLLKVLLELSHEQKLKQSSIETLSSAFDWKSSHMRVLLENEPWRVQNEHIRKACVQAFGIGGLNAQVFVEGPEGIVNAPRQQECLPLGKIAIIGVGCVLPGSFNVKAFKSRINKEEVAITAVPKERTRTLFTVADRINPNSLYFKARGGFIEDFCCDWRRFRIPPKHIKNANALKFIILESADQAITSAGYRSHLQKVDSQCAESSCLKALDSLSTAIIVGARSDSDFLATLNLETLTPVYQERLEKALEGEGKSSELAHSIGEDFSAAVYGREGSCIDDETGCDTISTHASRIAKTYDLKGGAFTLDAGNVSSFSALRTAALFLNRRADLRAVVCVVGCGSMHKNELKKCAELGVTPGEGAVAFVLKRVKDAREDDDKILAVISDIEEQRLLKNDAEHAIQAFKEFANSSATLASVDRPLFVETICDSDRSVERQFNSETKKLSISDKLTILGETRVSARELIGDLRSAAGAVAILDAIISMQGRDDNPRAVVSQWDRDGMVAQITLEKDPMETNKTPIKATLMTNEMQKSANSRQDDRVVFLFPGQGSQYARMLSPLFRSVPEAREERDKLDVELKSLGFPTFNELAVENASALGVDVAATQISLLVADTIVDRTLRRLGIKPDIIAGHSYGEYPAMVAAGTLTFADALRATQERCRIIDETIGKSATPSGMLSTNAPKDVVQKIFARLLSRFDSESFFISNRNAPDNTIISAVRPALEQIAEELKSEHCGSVILSVPVGFHSPLVAGVCSPLDNALSGIDFDFPTTPFMSGVSMRFESDPEVIRENLVEQMTKPVDFVEMIERAYRNGGRRFVEIGPKQVLTRLAAKILKDKPDASYYVCDYGPKGIDREFDASIVNSLRNSSVTVQFDPKSVIGRNNAEETKKSEPQQESFSTLHNDALPEEVVSYSGGPCEIGLARGRCDGERIRRALRRYADVAGTSSEKLLPNVNATDIARAQEFFGQSGYDELRGIAEGAGVPLAALIRHNLSVFPASREHIPEWGGFAKPNGGCSHFAGVTLDGEFVHGGNIDAPIMNILPNAIESRIAVRRPLDGYASVSILLTGLIGSRGGVNERGLAATTSDLLDDVYKNAPKDGLRRGIAIQTILDRCATVDEAIEFVKTTKLSGAKSIGLSDANGATALIEYAGDERNSLILKRWHETNHSTTLRTALAEDSAPLNSIARHERLQELLGSDDGRLELDSSAAFDVLRDEFDSTDDESRVRRFRTLNMICRSDNVFSWMFYRNEGVIRFQRSYSNALSRTDDVSGMVFPLDELMPEYRGKTLEQQAATTPQEERENRDATLNSERYNPLMTPQDYLAAIDDDYVLAKQDKLSTVRYEDRIVQTPPHKFPVTAPDGRVLLVAATPKNELANKVKLRIAELGGSADLITLTDESGAEKTRSVLAEEITLLCQGEFPRNVLLLASYDAAPRVFDSKEAWALTRSHGIAFPIVALQSWYKVALERKIDLTTLTVVAATRMGGFLGADGRTTRPEDGAMAGLMRSLQVETYTGKNARIFAYCVDHELDEDISIVAERLVAELKRSSTFAEDVGYRSGKRYAMRLVACRQIPEPKKVLTDKHPVWIVTGGRRGVTAELALGLGKKLGAKLCLIGSSDPAIPNIDEALKLDENGLKELKKTMARKALEEKKRPAEVWSRFERALETRKNLNRFKDAGIEVSSYNCDLSNFDEARALTRRIVEENGRIDGILFGSGFEKAAVFEKTSEETAMKI
ncbi:MAG: acyltransferase domain-containing protein, partial [Thermoguttaceae bacterium]|nr:acyltransferase domain-containing protein [Thermoguttaceae bacterium]